MAVCGDIGDVLSIGKLRGGGRAARYYERQVASGREDYYAGEGEARGAWLGRGAAATGRDGEVGDGDLETLLGGAGLRRVPSDQAIAGFDLTFRPPKSVSVLWGVASPAVALEVRDGHDAAVRDAMGYMERHACKARRGRDGILQVEGGGSSRLRFATGRHARRTRYCTRTSSWATSPSAQTGVGRPSMAATSTATPRRPAASTKSAA